MTTPINTTTTKAKTAARNTLLQGVLAAVILGASTGALNVVNSGEFSWKAAGAAIATAVVASVLAYVQHAYAEPYLAIRKALKSPK